MPHARNRYRKATLGWVVAVLAGCAGPSASGRPATHAATSAGEDAPRAAEHARLLSRHAALTKELTAIEARLRAQPWPSPSEPDAVMDPAVLTPRLRKAADGLGLAVEFLEPDCAEYPCLFLGKIATGAKPNLWDAPAFQDLKKSRTTMMIHYPLKNCEQSFFLVSAYPRTEHGKVLGERIQARA